MLSVEDGWDGRRTDSGAAAESHEAGTHHQRHGLVAGSPENKSARHRGVREDLAKQTMSATLPHLDSHVWWPGCDSFKTDKSPQSDSQASGFRISLTILSGPSIQAKALSRSAY